MDSFDAEVSVGPKFEKRDRGRRRRVRDGSVDTQADRETMLWMDLDFGLLSEVLVCTTSARSNKQVAPCCVACGK